MMVTSCPTVVSVGSNLYDHLACCFTLLSAPLPGAEIFNCDDVIRLKSILDFTKKRLYKNLKDYQIQLVEIDNLLNFEVWVMFR